MKCIKKSKITLKSFGYPTGFDLGTPGMLRHHPMTTATQISDCHPFTGYFDFWKVHSLTLLCYHYFLLSHNTSALPNSRNSNWHFITNIVGHFCWHFIAFQIVYVLFMLVFIATFTKSFGYFLDFFAILRPKWHSFILTFFRFMNGSESFSTYLRLQSGVVNWRFLDEYLMFWCLFEEGFIFCM